MKKLGFDEIYSHNRKTWSSYWSPLSVACCTMLVNIHMLVTPVITSALPGKTIRD